MERLTDDGPTTDPPLTDPEVVVPARSDRASPWPVVAMVGMAGAFFLYAASGLLAPWWGVAVLMVGWLWLFVTACRWWTPHPVRTLWLPLVAVVAWFAVLTAGAAWLGWSG